MSSTTVEYTARDHIARLILNRPEVDNTINQELAGNLVDICHQISGNDSIYAVIITGAGDAFCAGSELERAGGKPDKAVAGAPCSVSAAFASLDRPVIAAINGDAFGQGLELALSCDIRLASTEARFGFPDVAAGLLPMDGGTQRLPRIVGRGKALELILSAETIGAKEALEIGLVTGVFPPEKLVAEAEAMAQSITTKAPIALRYIKEAVNKGLDMTLDQGLRLEADLYFLIHTTADRTEGIRAFLEKRRPRFKGR